MTTRVERRTWIEDFVLNTDTRRLISQQDIGPSSKRITAMPPPPPQPSSNDAPLTNDQEAVAIQQGHEELDRIRQAFLDFQHAVRYASLYATMLPQLEQFGENMKTVGDILDDTIDYSALSAIGREKYVSYQQMRTDMLYRLYYHYQEGDNSHGNHT